MISLRPYHPEDRTALAAVFHRAVHAVPDALYGPEERAAWAPSPPRPERWTERFAAAPPVVALVDGSIAGFMTLEADGHLDLAYVDPDHQRRGVASALLAHLETHAAERRLRRLFAEVSHAARPFFERRGFRALAPREVVRGHQRLTHWTMEKSLLPLDGRARLFIVGNAGAGKSTLAKALAARLERARVDLDEVAFVDQRGTRRDVGESLTLLRARAGLDDAVVEGCYADIVGALAAREDHLIWLDLGVEDCLANARARPWEPHKWPSAEAQDAFLPQLLAFIATYPEAEGPTGRQAHADLFARFVGTKERYRVRPPVER